MTHEETVDAPDLDGQDLSRVPELDAFEDDVCEVLMHRVRRRSLYVPLATLLALGALLLGLPIFAILLRAVVDRIEPQGVLVGVLVLLVLCAAPALLPLLARDLLLRRYLRRLIRDRLRRMECLHGSYILLGQRADDGTVRCPECGRTTTLVALGLHSADELVPDATMNAWRDVTRRGVMKRDEVRFGDAIGPPPADAGRSDTM